MAVEKYISYISIKINDSSENKVILYHILNIFNYDSFVQCILNRNLKIIIIQFVFQIKKCYIDAILKVYS